MLDKYQEEIVRAKEKNILVVASPGSGKTTVIINRTGYLIKEMSIDPKNIVIITFTRAAAINMKERFKKLYTESQTPYFGTFHSLCYSILRNDRGKIKIISEREEYYIIEKVLKSYVEEVNEERIRDILNYISAYKTGYKTLDQLEQNINLNILQQCIKGYEEYKSYKGLLDFDDLQLQTLELFNKKHQLLEGYRKQFKFILVDEFQDCDQLQIDILKKLCKGNSLFAVGDEDQCIYGFRGARPDYMVIFNENFEKGVKKFLMVNYRSVKNIVEMSAKLIDNNKIRNKKRFTSCSIFEGCIFTERYFDERGQSDGIAKRILKRVNEKKESFSDNAVLYRTNMEARSFIDAFIKNKVPFRLLDKAYNFFDHSICKDLLSYMMLSHDLTNRESFKRIINKPFRYISKVNLEKLSGYKYKEDCFDILCNICSLPIFQYKELQRLKKDVINIRKYPLSELTDYILTKLEYSKYIISYCQKYGLSIEEVDEIINEFKEAVKDFTDIESFLLHVKQVGEELSKKSTDNEDTVILSTIHGVKGMEFKNVYVINCVDGNIPCKREGKESYIEEERRLFYVAITRAKENLYLSLCEYMRGKSKEISPFIYECGISDIIDRTVEFLIGSKVIHDSFGKGEIISINNGEMGIRFDDGFIRHFDMNKVKLQNTLKKMG
ncbi:putative ATP-dependent DNA helicase YjcD [Clostridium sp. N3C]|uniref:ATP-dependent helicase n=1 Tax=Clostridium sp. N3C TaxID=1776758 RepID=UPI00092DF406|nr:ATP-dependent helicase [Clostridium sp. N3C]SCN21628.1 putative ATP-dependent DNA helicase YjcD [Clostridium sp. N3C]